MKIRQIRSACSVVAYAGKDFLVDPWLAPKDAKPAFPFAAYQKRRQPRADLPCSIDELTQVDAVYVSHLHPDHFDATAKERLPKHLKMFAQSEADAGELRSYGFQDVEVLKETGTRFGDIMLYKTSGEHGRFDAADTMLRKLNISGRLEVSGIVFKHPHEKTLYICGDTVWCPAVKAAIDTHQPDVIIVFSAAAEFLEGGNIIMGKTDVYNVFNAAPKATIIATHMDNVSHAMITRAELKAFLEDNDMTSRVLVPDDGQAYTF
ncbi:MAG: MBL fold metallo-hydrolase [bacterium]|uniref:MBL fold metallo-hydrolase n=1 Tax=Candidatus Methylomirabilis tolerans TaxID=3123416 RepID=A0AAJ1AI42_9BACT|nr:MBL fold metallo-hydrolase [Candidatus Methylomirabilis sp.]